MRNGPSEGERLPVLLLAATASYVCAPCRVAICRTFAGAVVPAPTRLPPVRLTQRQYQDVIAMAHSASLNSVATELIYKIVGPTASVRPVHTSPFRRAADPRAGQPAQIQTNQRCRPEGPPRPAVGAR